MKWKKLSDEFPDDWESKILRTVGVKSILINSEWCHINDHLWHSGKRIDFEYDQIEWLDEDPPEPNQDELWDEVESILDKELEEEYGRHYMVGSSAIEDLKSKYTLSRK